MLFRRSVALAVGLGAVAAGPAAAIDFPRLGLFRKKTPKDDPPQKGKQALDTLRTDTDEKKREAAAAELADLDPRTNPDVVPGLISALQKDPTPAVRAAAADALGKLRPVQQPAGVALEQTLAADPVEGVRKAAQQSLWQYHLNGYRPTGGGGAAQQSPEPPLAKPKPVAAMPSPFAAKPAPTPVTAVPVSKPAVPPPPPVAAKPVTVGSGRAGVYPQTIEPPLARSKPVATVKEEPPAPKPVAPPTRPDVAKPSVPAIPTVGVPVVPSVPPPAQPPSIPPPNG